MTYDKPIAKILPNKSNVESLDNDVSFQQFYSMLTRNHGQRKRKEKKATKMEMDTYIFNKHFI